MIWAKTTPRRPDEIPKLIDVHSSISADLGAYRFFIMQMRHGFLVEADEHQGRLVA
jgi:hypothetical protein